MKMKEVTLLITASLVSGITYAASQSVIWGQAPQSLQKFSVTSPVKSSAKFALNKTKQNKNNADYQLSYQRAYYNNDATHERYQIKYKGIPVWGYQVFFHKNKSGKVTVTGMNVDGLDVDIQSTDAKLSPKQAEEKYLNEYKAKNLPIKFKRIEKVIYLDKNKKAILAYHLAFFSKQEKKQISMPNYIIDATTGKLLKTWNAARKERLGQGMGGNAFALPYRPGMFQHGSALPGLKSLGKFDVSIKDGFCHVENDNFRVMSLENEILGYDSFPISIFEEAMYGFKAFSYPCDAESRYLNYADGNSGPIHYSFSPVNDTMYFAQETVDMYMHAYGVDKPFGDDLPVRAYTHLGEMDNAFAIPTIIYEGQLLAHQQIVIGNGSQFLTAPTQTVIAHELSHNFTFNNSNLVYEGQAGGINESFSDMAAVAILDFLKERYDWYWDGEDFSLGREATLDGSPIRYMDEPSKDGFSISHADDYRDGLDPHFSSGVFNKAFYLLSKKPGWNVQKAFQVMVDANQNYWSPIAYYDFAACGVIQATLDKKQVATPVIEAFAEVGVYCPMFKGKESAS
jgi:pseudolysin